MILEVQKAQEAEMEAEMEEAFANHKPFKTAKQIRAEKYGVDEDEEGKRVELVFHTLVNFG